MKRWLCVVLSLAILVIAIAVLCFLFFQSQIVSPDDEDWKKEFGKVYVSASVTCDAADCAAIGGHVLRQLNGSAVDAAIATLFCMGLVIPESLGIGGGGWFTVFDKKTGKVTVISGRESAPTYASEDMFHGIANRSDVGVDAVAVPGELAAYFKAHELFGKVHNFSLLIQPTIDLARKGFTVGAHLANAIKQRVHKIQAFNATLVKRLLWNNDTDDYYKEGDVMKRPDLAETLESIQREGRDSMYSAKGSIAQRMIADMQAQGSRMTIDDLVNYKLQVEERKARVLPNGMNLYSPGLPASGPVLEFIVDTVMRVLWDTHPLSDTDVDLFNKQVVEAMKLGYGQRGFLGDTAFETGVEGNDSYASTAAALQRLEDPDFAQKMAELIASMNHTVNNVTFYQRVTEEDMSAEYQAYVSDHGTAGMAVVDSSGTACAVGSTVNAYFGSYVLSASTGILLNNEMDDFSNDWINTYSVPPGKHNRIAAAKRPVSSMAPALLTSGTAQQQTFEMAIAASGGTHITTSQALVILKTLLFANLTLESAVREARIHHQLQPMELKYEKTPAVTVATERLTALRAAGHNVTAIEGRGSIVMAIKKTADGRLETVTDWRKQGSVDGY